MCFPWDLYRTISFWSISFLSLGGFFYFRLSTFVANSFLSALTFSLWMMISSSHHFFLTHSINFLCHWSTRRDTMKQKHFNKLVRMKVLHIDLIIFYKKQHCATRNCKDLNTPQSLSIFLLMLLCVYCWVVLWVSRSGNIFRWFEGENMRFWNEIG